MLIQFHKTGLENAGFRPIFPAVQRLASYEGQMIPVRSTLYEELLEEFQAKEQNSGME